MSKVAIVSVADKKNMTMISAYTNLLKKYNISYDVICIDRYGESSKGEEDKLFAYSCPISSSDLKIKKAFFFLKFLCYAIGVIRRKKYKYVIVWNENTSALLWVYLKYFAKIPYCVNIRDLDFQDYFFLKYMVVTAVCNSSFSTICVPNVIDAPKNYEYVLLLSQNEAILRNCNRKADVKRCQKIVISYVGKVRFLDADRRIMQAFKNDKRFLLRFVGDGSEKHMTYLEEHGINNVELIGRFEPDETSRFLEESDILDAYYGEKFKYYKSAAPIKFGYGPYLCMPVLVAEDTYMDHIGAKYGFTFSVPKGSDISHLPDRLYKWYNSICFERFKTGCQRYCDYVEQVNDNFEKVLLRDLKSYGVIGVVDKD